MSLPHISRKSAGTVATLVTAAHNNIFPVEAGYLLVTSLYWALLSHLPPSNVHTFAGKTNEHLMAADATAVKTTAAALLLR
jgi:hypothetical protein